MVRKPLISIKDSLRNTAPAAPAPVVEAPAKDEEKPVTRAGEAVDAGKVLEAWKAYTKSIEKEKPRVFATLNNNQPVEEEGVFRISLNSDSQLENFRSNIRPGLLAHIRKTTGMEAVEIEGVLTETEARKKKVYTDKDKLEFLVKKNPDMTEFYARFGLDFDR